MCVKVTSLYDQSSFAFELAILFHALFLKAHHIRSTIVPLTFQTLHCFGFMDLEEAPTKMNKEAQFLPWVEK